MADCHKIVFKFLVSKISERLEIVYNPTSCIEESLFFDHQLVICKSIKGTYNMKDISSLLLQGVNYYIALIGVLLLDFYLSITHFFFLNCLIIVL